MAIIDNIKTINNNSLIGVGNIDVTAQAKVPSSIYLGQGTNYIGGFNLLDGSMLFKFTYSAGSGSSPLWRLDIGNIAAADMVYIKNNNTINRIDINKNGNYIFNIWNGDLIFNGSLSLYGYLFLIQYANENNGYMHCVNCVDLVVPFKQ